MYTIIIRTCMYNYTCIYTCNKIYMYVCTYDVRFLSVYANSYNYTCTSVNFQLFETTCMYINTSTYIQIWAIQKEKIYIHTAHDTYV